jgi:deoxyribonuclease-2
LNDQGEPVPYWIMLKVPEETTYFYFDAQTQALELSEKKLDTGALLHTVNQIHVAEKDYILGLYNDDTPDEKKSASRAHAKGVLLTGIEQGFWLSHSLPRFPPPRNVRFQVPDIKFGQHFVCMTLKANEFENLVEDLKVRYPQFYETIVESERIQQQLPLFSDFIKSIKEAREGNEETYVSSLSIIDGTEMHTFAKSKIWQDDLFVDLIAANLSTSLLVETWRNGARENVLPSYCRPEYNYEVRNVLQVKLGTFSWKFTRDHSKWAISTEEKSYVCFADTNRQLSQRKRGGGAVCLKDKELWSAMSQMITDSQSCSSAI